MRHQRLTVAALGALALLAGCSKQDPAAQAETALTAEEIAEKRAELDRLEAELAQQQPAPAEPAAPAPAPRPSTASTSPSPASTSKPASTASSSRPASTAPVARSVTVPAGTEVPVALVTGLSTKTAKVGQTVEARVASDVLVDGRTAIPAGLTVAGSVVEVVSGSDRIGGTPTLVLAFDRIQLPGGTDVPIAGDFKEVGKSDNTRDAVKIVGGAAAGALLADQIGNKKKDRNRVIGGILGAAAGAVAAKETGTEVKLDEGAMLTLVLSAPVEIPRS
ncbi:MAG: glycine zipper 2TM domain-containing protein [Pseudomonadota bacterium]|jgi:hypothetical protein|nr:MAG: hypothetical protein DIU62_03550 [Pseudomonadota bacterium]